MHLMRAHARAGDVDRIIQLSEKIRYHTHSTYNTHARTYTHAQSARTHTHAHAHVIVTINTAQNGLPELY